MTDIVNPSFKRLADSFLMSGTIEGKTAVKDYVVDAADSPTILADSEGLTGLNGFAQSSSSSSFNVTIDPGEAFVAGTWLARDTSTTVTLASDTTDQTVYVGWVDGNSNDVTIGLQSAFSGQDQFTELFTFDTDTNGVTGARDDRRLGSEVELFTGDADITFDGSDITIISGDGTDSFIISDASIEALDPFIAPDITVDQGTLNNQATVSDGIVRYDQLTNLESTVSGKADDPHDNTQHSEDYQTATDVTNSIDDHQSNDVHVANQPPQTHDHSGSGSGGNDIDLSGGKVRLPVRSNDPATLEEGLFWVRDDL